MIRSLICIVFFLVCPSQAVALRSDFSGETRTYIRHEAPVIALKNVIVVDGTGKAARPQQMVLLKQGKIAAVGEAANVEIPEHAEVLDMSGKSVLPGFIMVHEHMFYPVGDRHYNQHSVSFPRLYLAGGVTTMRTGGSIETYTDLNIPAGALDSMLPETGCDELPTAFTHMCIHCAKSTPPGAAIGKAPAASTVRLDGFAGFARRSNSGHALRGLP